MRQGQTIEIRSGLTGFWQEVLVDLVSPNQFSLAVSADEGLRDDQGMAIDRETGRQVLLLGKREDNPLRYQEIRTGSTWYVKCDHEPYAAALLTQDGWACCKCARIIGKESPDGDKEKE